MPDYIAPIGKWRAGQCPVPRHGPDPAQPEVYEAWAREQPESERPSYEEWTDDEIKKLVPLNRWQQPEDIAAMAVFLASSRGRNITGQTINVDGGYVMHW
jgi:2-hydroxycyclohexanecarboxyl-CoA dehydrogenase